MSCPTDGLSAAVLTARDRQRGDWRPRDGGGTGETGGRRAVRARTTKPKRRGSGNNETQCRVFRLLIVETKAKNMQAYNIIRPATLSGAIAMAIVCLSVHHADDQVE